MTIQPLTNSIARPDAPEAPQTLEEAARQFETVLARQFVDVMTDGLFNEGLAGEDAPGWMGSHRDAQRDTLAGVLAEHLVESGAFRLADLLVRQWQASAAPAGPETAALVSTDIKP